MDNLLVKCFLATQKSLFHQNELAFLALTSKIENPLRDRWALKLFNEIGQKLLVAREWKRTDLAILDGIYPKVLIELKAMYTFDAAMYEKNIDAYVNAMNNDIEKAKKIKDSSTDIYTVLLATHPKSPIPKKYTHVIKYSKDINSTFRKFQNSNAIKKKAIQTVNTKLNHKTIVKQGELIGGSAFGIETDVLFWIIKA